jgi:hypothetical protein
MKPSSKPRRLAGILAVAAVTAACTASRQAASPPAAPEHGCTTLPIASASAAGTSGQDARPDLLSLPRGVRGVAVQSSSNAWAVGAPPADVRPQKAIVAHWNGAAWTTLSNRGLPQLSVLGAVAFFPGGAWAVGEHGLTQHGDGGGRPKQLIVRLTGTTMRRVPVAGPADGLLADVAATSAANAWAVGYLGGIGYHDPLILHWNGTAWKRAPLPAALGRGEFVGVAAASRTNAWAVMNPRTGVLRPGIRPRIVHWNGRRWGDVVSPAIGVSYHLFDVAATSAKNVWAVGAGGSTRAVILHWNGLRWTCALTPKVHRGYSFRALFAVSASAADNALAVGSSGTGTLALHWNGHGWKRFKTPRRGGFNALEDVTFIPRSGRAWAVDDAGSATLIFRWDGTAWH